MTTATAGVTCLAAAGMGWLRGPLGPVARGLLGAASLALIFPGAWTDGVGLAILVFFVARPPTR